MSAVNTDNLKAGLQRAIAYRPLQYGLAVLLVLLIVYLVGKSAGKSAAQAKRVEYPKGESVSETWVTSVATRILNDLWDALDGWTDTPDQKAAAIRPLLTVSNAELTYIYNAYNVMHYSDGSKKTLYTHIDSEWFGLGLSPAGQTKQDVLNRMLLLGLT